MQSLGHNIIKHYKKMLTGYWKHDSSHTITFDTLSLRSLLMTDFLSIFTYPASSVLQRLSLLKKSHLLHDYSFGTHFIIRIQ